MRNIHNHKRRVCVKPLCSRLEVIQKVKAPAMAKQCKSFAGMVNFVSIFVQNYKDY